MLPPTVSSQCSVNSDGASGGNSSNTSFPTPDPSTNTFGTNNKNYVNFNQFIMQHNFGGPSSNNMTNGLDANFVSASGSNANFSRDSLGYAAGVGVPTAAEVTTSYPNAFSLPPLNYSTAGNPFNYNSEAASSNSLYSSAGNGNFNMAGYSNTNLFENIYTPFGTISAEGLGASPNNFFTNPYVKGGNSNNTVLATTNLKISAAEFVPRFGKLSLNDEISNSMTLNNDDSSRTLKDTKTCLSDTKQNINNANESIKNENVALNSVVNVNATSATSAPQSNSSTSTTTSPLNVMPSGSGNLLAADSYRNSSHSLSRRNGYSSYSGSYNSVNGVGKHHGGLSKSEKIEKPNASDRARAERVREHDNRRYQSGGGGGVNGNGDRHAIFNVTTFDRVDRNERQNRSHRYERNDRFDRGERDKGERGDRFERNDRERGDRNDRFDRNDREKCERGDRFERKERENCERGYRFDRMVERDNRFDCTETEKDERSEHFDRNDREKNHKGDRFDRGERDKGERGDRFERGDRERTDRRGNRDRDRYDNNRSNKRRDDWNRNRNLRVEEKCSSDNGKESPLTSPEKKPSPKKEYPENEKLSQREKLIRDIELRRLECLVCVEPIKGRQGVWACHNCYHILHLQCITKWAASSKSEEGWRCPACQNVLKDVPSEYYCFCGKVKNPPLNRNDIAHSCGNVCRRIENCPHACTLLCHPGPCPPCQANVARECGCGKTTQIMKCCYKENIECDGVCDKLLNCEVHTCTANCHMEKCEPCDKKINQTCHCHKLEREVACTRESHDKESYSCGKPCGKKLSCGNHKCKDCCHAGECRPCKLSPEQVTTCPCGKTPILAGERKSCTDPIPVCDSVCNKTLRCGKAAHPHHCTVRCHVGNCPPCNKQTSVKCRCGHMDQLIKCRQLSTRADDARCKKRCTKKRSCGKHKCNQECCIDIDHICPLPCNYTLSCGKHKCDQPCHRGNCPPCYRSSFEELFCECGAEVIYPPVPCGTKRPICKRPCSRVHSCDHPPQHTCHSAATCPPCMLFTTKWCFGQHESRKTIPCSQESFSCGLPCNKPLPCGRHKCIKPCHEGACQTAGEICKQSCTTLRPSCGHKCMAPCHDGDCPETQCKEMVEVQCDCGNRKQMRTCHDLAREFTRIATARLASSMAETQRGNYMELSEILAPVKVNKTNKTLDCNDECRLLERNRRLAVGLQVRNAEAVPKPNTKYSDFIRNFAKRDPTLVKSIYDALTNLVKLAKESKQKSRSHSFPIMNREKRQLVHELCEMFGVESVAYDPEPNRNVVATAYKDRTWFPATSIMEVVQRESGQRRVPVPSNNAWGIKR